ncbi:MAG: phosphotransferase [Candidatus Poribacteria bacterium]|nr:phosphotransferase [Candidatus Poribacteria bacterium]
MKSLSPQQEASIHQNYGLKVAAAIPIGAGAMSFTLILHTDRGTLFLKRYQSPSSSNLNQSTGAPRISFTHVVQDYLCKRGIPIPRLLRNRSGDTLTVEGNEIYAIYKFVEGCDYDAVEPTGALQSAGETLGRMHNELRGFRPSVDFQWMPMHDEVIGSLRRRLERIRATAPKTGDYPVSESRIDEWKIEVERLAVELPTRDQGDLIIHGDYRAQNLKFDAEGKVKAILDLDTARPANRAYDLAYALVFFPAVYQDTPLTPHQKSVFLDAYEAVYPLTEKERNALPAHFKLAYLRGMTLWLHLHDLGGMRDRVRPWLQGYLNNEASLTQ